MGTEASLYSGKVVGAPCEKSTWLPRITKPLLGPIKYLARGRARTAASAATDVRDSARLVVTSMDATASDYVRSW